MSVPKLTIGVPVYDGVKTIRRCLESLEAQTFRDFVVHVNDNASTDGTSRILREIADRDPRFVVHRYPENVGRDLSATGLITAAKSPYFALVHADLAWAPTYAEECLAVLENDPRTVLAYSQCQFVDEDGQELDLYRDEMTYDQEEPGQRFINVLQFMGWCTAFHGLARQAPFAGAFLKVANTGNAAGDNEMLALLALQGKMVQVEQPLFYRLKDSFRITGETFMDRSRRLTNLTETRKNISFITFALDHCRDLVESGLPPATVDSLVNRAMVTVKQRFNAPMTYELDRIIKMVLSGDIKLPVGVEPGQEPAVAPLGQYHCLDYVYIRQMLADLEAARVFYSDYPLLNHARAIVMVWLGRPEEALVAVNRELTANPTHGPSLELKLNLEKKLGRDSAEAGPPAAAGAEN